MHATTIDRSIGSYTRTNTLVRVFDLAHGAHTRRIFVETKKKRHCQIRAVVVLAVVDSWSSLNIISQ